MPLAPVGATVSSLVGVVFVVSGFEVCGVRYKGGGDLCFALYCLGFGVQVCL